MDENKEAFIRWQGYTLQQLSFVNNLLIGLSTGILALLFNTASNSANAYSLDYKFYISASVVFIFISLVFGISTAWNRLDDFRMTVRIAYKRWKKETEGIRKLRTKSKFLGKITWWCLGLQLAFFIAGSIFMLLIVILEMN